MKKVISVLIILFLTRFSYAEYFTIRHYQVNMKVNPNTVLNIHEKIDVHFTTPRHGIFREIPVRARINNRWQYIRLYHIRVNDGKTMKVIKYGNKIKLRFGRANQYVNGNKSYDFSYDAHNAMLTKNTNYDEIYWNLIGTEWNTDISAADMVLEFPFVLTNHGNIDFRVFVGQRGYRTTLSQYEKFNEQNDRNGRGLRSSGGHTNPVSIEGNKLYIHISKKLPANTGVTLQLRIKKGMLNPSIWDRILILWKKTNVYIIFVLWFLFSLYLWTKYGKDKTVHVMPEFMPPKVSPSEAISLIKQSSHFDLASTLVDLARRGYIVIGEDKEKNQFLKKIKSPDNKLRSYEKELMKKIFSSDYATDDVVTVSDLEQSFYGDLEVIKAKFNTSFENKNFFTVKGEHWSSVFIGINAAIVIIAVSLLFIIDFGSSYQIRKWYLFMIAVFINNVVFAVIMHKKTDKGQEAYEQVLGFKEFINRAEKDRIERLFAENNSYFDDTISYALALGLGKKWAKHFEMIIHEPPSWYQGYYYGSTFSTMLFASSLISNVNGFSQAAVSTPPSSGGSSGGFSGGGFGGSVGGGFGGGGGGSW